MLLLSLVMLTGICETASALVQADVASACCAGEADDEDYPFTPCQEIDCSCVSCIFLIPATVPDLAYSCTEVVPPRSIHALMLPSGHCRTIEYPPETL